MNECNSPGSLQTFAGNFAVNKKNLVKIKSLKPLLIWLQALAIDGVVPRGGIEPPTPAFSVLCSTD
jgi:hypothetical protein